MPKVSVVIPTFNRAHYICETIDSVLSQRYKDYEIIIIDDGSSDNTWEVLEQYREKIKYFYQKNSGLSVARNQGVSESKGEYIAFLDSDDLWLPHKLDKQVDILDKNSDLAFVCSDSYVIDESGRIIKLWTKGYGNKDTFRSLFETNFVLVPTVVMRRKCFDEAGGFDERFIMSQDIDLWLRVAKRHKFKHIDMPLAKYRLHKEGLSKNFDLRIHENEAIIRKPEIGTGISKIIKRIRRSKLYYQHATYYYGIKNFYHAGLNYLKAIIVFPFIGYYYFSKETDYFKFSLPYRIIKVYLLVALCFFRSACHKFKIKRIIFKAFILPIILFSALEFMLKKIVRRPKSKTMGLLNIEFFHKEAGGFGGYGKCAKNIAEYFNSNVRQIKVEVLLTRAFKKPKIKTLHNTKVIVAPDSESSNIIGAFRYARMLNKRNIDFLMAMEYCTDYQYTLSFLPNIPVLIWIRDPRPTMCMREIFTVSLEFARSGMRRDFLDTHQENIRNSINKIIQLNKIIKRKIVFAVTANYLAERAKKLYAWENINPIFLPTPVEVSSDAEINYSSKPSVCFLGRLDPIKRPWIFFELAKRFKDVDFLVAGTTHFPNIMNPIITKYSSIPNLKFLGHIGGKEKDELLKNTWAIVNTSVHEALPVSFLESFAHGKPVISCQNPDNIVGRFGEYTGELLGDGFDEQAIGVFAEGLSKILSNNSERINKGKAGKGYIAANYSFQKFEQQLAKIIREMEI